MNAKIIEVRITAKELRMMPEAVRHTFLLLSHGMNEISFTHRMFYATSNNDHPIGPAHNVNFCQLLFVVRLHISNLFEVWEVLRKSRKNWIMYLSELDKSAQDAHERLKFSLQDKNSKARTVRNKFGFHYPISKLSQISYLKHHDEDDEFVFYVHKTRMNSNYHVSDFLLFQAMRREIFGDCDEKNMKKHFEMLMEESVNLSSMMIEFLEPLVGTMLKANLPAVLGRIEHVNVEMVDVEELQLPYFLNVPGETS